MAKRGIFLSYCSKKQALAEAIATEIKITPGGEFDVHLWNEDEQGGGLLLDNIISQIRECQYGVAILSCDDKLQIEDKLQGGRVVQRPQWAPRDNVILELGFFLSKFGKARTAIISVTEQTGLTPKMPTDMAGWFIIPFDAKNIEASARNASNQLQKHFQKREADVIPTLGKVSGNPRGFNVLTLDDIKEHWGQFTQRLYCLNPSWGMECNPEWLSIHRQRYLNPNFVEANYIVDIDRGRDAHSNTDQGKRNSRVVHADHDVTGIVRFFKELCGTDENIRLQVDSKLRVFICPGAKSEITTFVSQYRSEKRAFLFVKENTFVNAVLEANTPEQVERLHQHVYQSMQGRKPFTFSELENIRERILGLYV